VAAVTVNMRVTGTGPNCQIIDATLAATGDTFDSKFRTVKAVVITPHSTWGADDYIYWSESGGVVTFTCGGTNAGTATYTVAIYG